MKLCLYIFFPCWQIAKRRGITSSNKASELVCVRFKLWLAWRYNMVLNDIRSVDYFV